MNKTSSFAYFATDLTWPIGVLIFLAGVIVGLFYFWNLWWAIARLPAIRKRGAFLFLTSFVRLAVFFAALVLLAQNNPLKMFVFFGGFIITRYIVLGFQKKKVPLKTTESVRKSRPKKSITADFKETPVRKKSAPRKRKTHA